MASTASTASTASIASSSAAPGGASVPASGAPSPIDPRGPRFNQAALTIALTIGFLFDWWPVASVFAVVLLLGAVSGARFGPFLRLYAQVIRPRLGPPTALADPRPPRFAAAEEMGVTL